MNYEVPWGSVVGLMFFSFLSHLLAKYIVMELISTAMLMIVDCMYM